MENKTDSDILEKRKNSRLDIHKKTGSMSTKEYAEYRRELSRVKNYEQIRLPKDEYAKVMSEFNTHMSDEDRKHALVTKPIGNYFYTIINNGFDNYTVIAKKPIEKSIIDFLDLEE